jgi:hypothetical protein
MDLLRKAVSPIGRVDPRYYQYVGWSFVSNVFASMQSILSSHSMLSVISLADTEILITSNYIMKDMVGQMGGLYYIDKMGNKFDRKPKMIVKHAMISQQTAMVVECLTPLIPNGLFIPVAGGANMIKNISFTGFGSINTRIIQTLAASDNIGEIYSKLSVVNAFGSTLGMGLGLLIAVKIPDHGIRLGVMPILIAGRVWTFKKAVKGLI